MSYVGYKTLNNLFYNTNLMNIKKIEGVVRPKPETPIKGTDNSLTPIRAKIVKHMTPISRKRTLEAIEEEDAEQEKRDILSDYEDPDYQEKMENNELGFWMEDFVSYNGVCPICKNSTLRKYKAKNMPVVDFICTNKEYHDKTDTCCLWQLKISVEGRYFDHLGQGYITVGSKKIGCLPHTTLGDCDMGQKKVVPGYICIELNRVSDDIYNINNLKSFIIIPDYSKKTPEPYYFYYPTKPSDKRKNYIRWNDNMTSLKPIRDLFNIKVVDTRIFYINEMIVHNPYSEYEAPKKLRLDD